MTPLEQLETAVAELVDDHGLLDQLRDLLPTSASVPGDGGTRQKVAGSPAPWNNVIGSLLMDIHAGTRQLEAELFRVRFNMEPHYRGGSDANTVEAMHRIVQLAIGAPDFAQRDAVRDVNSWIRAAKRIEAIGGEHAWTPLPRSAGEAPRSCPHCGFFSLRICKPLGVVRCTTRACRNAEGRRWTWTVEELLTEAT
jgi:hypothetical protein